MILFSIIYGIGFILAFFLFLRDMKEQGYIFVSDVYMAVLAGVTSWVFILLLIIEIIVSNRNKILWQRKK